MVLNYLSLTLSTLSLAIVYKCFYVSCFCPSCRSIEYSHFQLIFTIFSYVDLLHHLGKLQFEHYYNHVYVHGPLQEPEIQLVSLVLLFTNHIAINYAISCFIFFMSSLLIVEYTVLIFHIVKGHSMNCNCCIHAI